MYSLGPRTRQQTRTQKELSTKEILKMENFVSKFSGNGSGKRFLEDLETYFLISKTEEQYKTSILQSQLQGPARSWIENLGEEQKANYNTVKEEFKKQFKTDKIGIAQTSKLLAEGKLTMRPQETIPQYVERAQEFLLHTDLSAQQKLDIMVDNLPKEIKAAVIVSQPKSFSELSDFGRKFGAIGGQSQDISSITTQLTQIQQEIMAMTMMRDAPRTRNNWEQRQQNRGHYNRPQRTQQPQQQQQQQQPSPRKCNRCGGEYHDRQECKAIGAQCYSCHKFNHYQRVCRSKNRGFMHQ